MTCIVGLEHKGKVYIGADSSSVSGYDKTTTALKKVFIVDNRFIIGYTSSFRMGQLLQYKLSPEKQTKQADLEYLATVFIDELRAVLNDNGYAKIESNEESGGVFLVGYNGKLYTVHSDYQVNRDVCGYAVVGAGDTYALASMYNNSHMSPKLRVKNALKTASNFSTVVYKPFMVKKL